ncbi:MAG: carbonic anhydrase [Hyphomicrobiales bacterium]
MGEIESLVEGYRVFYQKYFLSGDTLFRELTRTGQSPKTMIIACSDSRVDPSIIMNSEPGDIFVVRNVANLVPPFEADESGLHGVSAALEFSVRILEVKNILVLGDSDCAGIHALMHDEVIQNTDFIGKWMSVAKAAAEKTRANNPDLDDLQLQHTCEKESVLLSLGNILTFPWIKSRVENGEIKLHGWYFSMEQGHLLEFNPEKGDFDNIV